MIIANMVISILIITNMIKDSKWTLVIDDLERSDDVIDMNVLILQLMMGWMIECSEWWLVWMLVEYDVWCLIGDVLELCILCLRWSWVMIWSVPSFVLPFCVAILIAGCGADALVICGHVNCGSLCSTVCCIVYVMWPGCTDVLKVGANVKCFVRMILLFV